jgi:ferredoxin-type protein NapF
MNQMTRARFLRGDWHKTPLAPSPEAVARIAPSCLAYRNVTCRSCADICETVAIIFHPQVGGEATPAIIGSRCTGCGECRLVCPAGAIGLAQRNLDGETA